MAKISDAPAAPEIKISEEHLRIAESLGLGFWKYDFASNSLEWDTSVYGRYGVDRATFPTPLDFWTLCLTEESKKLAERTMQRALSGEKDYEGTFELVLPNGTKNFVFARAQVARNGDNSPAYLYGINLDVTEQTLIENENKKLVAQLREAQSIANIGSWTFDLRSNDLSWSHQLYQIFEIPEPQPLGQLYSLYRSRVHPEDLPELDRLVERAIETGEGFVLNHRLELDEGRIKYVQGAMRVSKDQYGKPQRLSGTCRDLSKEIEIQREIDAERAKSNRIAHLAALGEVVAGVAHEINNPLAIIDGNAGLLPEFVNDPKLFSSAVASISNACARISKIINGLKRFARGGGTAEFEMHAFSLVVADALELIAVKANGAGVDVVTMYDTGAHVLCDKMSIEQVVINVVSNAIDAAKDSPEKLVKVSALEEGSDVVLRVTDSGPGISVGHREKLFVPFFTTKDIGEGTGLGLSISKGIIEDHAGSIAFIESSPSTCFEVRLGKCEAN
ncbi:MAG: ATP-binding protein [Bdellovibrionota bacterium]